MGSLSATLSFERGKMVFSILSVFVLGMNLSLFMRFMLTAP